MRKLEYLEPKTLAEATSLLMQHGTEVAVIAGGTDVVVRMRRRELEPRYLVSIEKLPELMGLELTPAGNLRLGALTTFHALEISPLIRHNFPILLQAAQAMGTPQICNVATVGGNLCNASPAADSAPALLCLDAIAHIQGLDGERAVPLTEFFTGPGSTVLQRGEILTGLEIPPLPVGAVDCYVKIGRIRGPDLAILGLGVVGYPAARNAPGWSFRIAMGSVAPTPIRAIEAEAVLAESTDDDAIEEASAAAVRVTKPISDVRATAYYRSLVVKNLTKRTIRWVLGQVA